MGTMGLKTPINWGVPANVSGAEGCAEAPPHLSGVEKPPLQGIHKAPSDKGAESCRGFLQEE